MLVVALGGLIFVPETSALSGEGAEVLNKEAENTAPTDQQAADDTDKDVRACQLAGVVVPSATASKR